MVRQQKITLGEVRAMGIRRLLVYCSDYKCSHNLRSAPINGRITSGFPILSRYSPVRLAGLKEAEVRADFNWAIKQNKTRPAVNRAGGNCPHLGSSFHL